MLASMLVSGMTSQYNLRNLTVNIIFPAEIFANKPFTTIIEVTNNRKKLPAFFIRIELLGQSHGVTFLKAKESHQIIFKTSLPKRGLYKNFPVIISSRFPFGFFSRFLFLSPKQSVIVYPEPYRCDYFELPIFKDNARNMIEDSNVFKIGQTEDEIISIREYHKGDPKKSINWKATAKTGALKVNQRASETPRILMIDLDDIEVEQDVERVLSFATYLVIESVKKGYLVGIKGQNVFIPPGTGKSHLKSILETLALYDPNEKTS